MRGEGSDLPICSAESAEWIRQGKYGAINGLCLPGLNIENWDTRLLLSSRAWMGHPRSRRVGWERMEVA